MRLFRDWPVLTKEDALPLLSIKFAANPIYNELIQQDKSLTKVFNEIRKKAIKCLDL